LHDLKIKWKRKWNILLIEVNSMSFWIPFIIAWMTSPWEQSSPWDQSSYRLLLKAFNVTSVTKHCPSITCAPFKNWIIAATVMILLLCTAHICPTHTQSLMPYDLWRDRYECTCPLNITFCREISHNHRSDYEILSRNTKASYRDDSWWVGWEALIKSNTTSLNGTFLAVSTCPNAQLEQHGMADQIQRQGRKHTNLTNQNNYEWPMRF